MAQCDSVLGYHISLDTANILMTNIARGIVNLGCGEEIRLRVGLDFEGCAAADAS